MGTIRELLKSITDWVFAAAGTVLERLASDSSYREGFLACFVVIVVVGALSSAVSWAWGLVQTFFHATHAPPAPGAGPTPVHISGGCAGGALVLLLFAIVALFLLSRLVRP